MNAFKQKYKFSPTFKIGSLIILIFSGIAIAFGVGLFIFGMAWLLMGIYQGGTINDSKVYWGITMMVLGFYVSTLNLFSLTLTAMAMNQKNPKNLLVTAIVAIAGVVAMIGGIILLFTPIIENDKKPVKSENEKGPDDGLVTIERTKHETTEKIPVNN